MNRPISVRVYTVISFFGFFSYTRKTKNETILFFRFVVWKYKNEKGFRLPFYILALYIHVLVSVLKEGYFVFPFQTRKTNLALFSYLNYKLEKIKKGNRINFRLRMRWFVIEIKNI